MTRNPFPLNDILIGYPSTGPRYGAAALLTEGTVVDLFTTSACTVALDALAGDGVTPATSVTVGNGVVVPRFYGSNDGATVVYGRIRGATGDGFPLYTTAVSAGGGTGGGVTATDNDDGTITVVASAGTGGTPSSSTVVDNDDGTITVS